MNERISHVGDDTVVAPLPHHQRPLYASDEDESDNDAAAAETTPLEFKRPLHEHSRNHLIMEEHLVEDTDAESENDDEMMNPYVMNPSFQSVNERSRNLDSAALLPPSMELANVTTTQRQQPQSSPDNQMDKFDPYSPTRRIGRKDLDDMQLEMEEESIDFMSPTPMKNNPSYNKPKFTMFGPLVHEQHSLKERDLEGFEDCESSFIDSTSFSPVLPSHHHHHNNVTQRQSHYSNSNAEYGEAMPLSGNPPSAARRRKHHQHHGQGTLGAIKALGGDTLSWVRGDYGYRHPFSHTSRRQYSRPSWLAYFRLFVVVLATIFALSTMTMMKHMLFNEIDTSSTVVKYQQEAEAEKSARSNRNPDLLVLKKIENARLKAREKKQHWWNRKKAIDGDGDVDVELGEKGTNGKQNVVQVESGSEMGHNQAAAAATINNKDAFQGVIVESAEDGTLLIKLPPPRMHLEQPSASKGSPQGGLAEKTEEQQDESVLIKLPYPEQRRTLSEKPDFSKGLKFSPLPFIEHKDKRHDHGLSVLESLRSEFDSWTLQHEKTYSSHNEKEHRFQIWRSSHKRIQKKNRMHGPCWLTGKAVFGHGPFSDLSPDEFREKYLTGYQGPKFHKKHAETAQASKTMRGIPPSRQTTGEIKSPSVGSLKRHPNIQRKLEEHVSMKYEGNFVSGCRSWLDVSCILRKIFGYSVMGGTMEPVYDENSYPSAIDWRAMGIVSSVHSQESCGACWAITATETIESAYAIATGKLINLAEEEVIACDGTCEMCSGGWPQNAYEYVMKHNGLPKRSSNYDADFLLTLTSVINEGSDEMSEYETSSYFGQICPAGTREGGDESNSHSGDNQYGTGSSATRYGQIKGYGYATDRCVCYSDGSGCDCDNQNEKTAVLNIASYGPAAVCLEASTWADYSYGIITSASGCTSGFSDMNHCVEVVGYAFTDVSNDEDNNSNSHSGDGGDGGKREGYWIVKNQWSTYWGMGGYAYVAMGDNTCGILNDMTQVYMEN
mmetsp:Transcript_31767/g.64187  ORF Transcript_31767/g.64187 Transcript_31767/m.64187 type:complete len:1004 (-) Transcript_31767:120-3131(-)